MALSSFFQAPQRGAVGASVDFKRVRDLPRRELDLSEKTRADMEKRLKLSGGTETLWPIQAAALKELEECQGGLLPIGVGCGKSRIAFLAPTVIDCERPLVLYPAAVREQTEQRVLPACYKNWELHVGLHHASIETLQTDRGLALLDKLRPDLVVVDEAHLLKNPQAARTKRLFKYLKMTGARAVFMSGTMCRRSIHEFWHMVVQALGEGAPVPLRWTEARDWADALDESPAVAIKPGALLQLCAEGESPREGYRRRLVSTRGVIAHEGVGECPASIRIMGVDLPTPIPEIERTMQSIDERWVKGACGNEIELSDPLSVWAAKREAAMGFCYRWEWADGKVDEEWLRYRKDWAETVREICHRGYADTEMTAARWLDSNGAKRLAWHASCQNWRQVRDRPGPKTVADWFTYHVLAFVTQQMREVPGLLVWARERAVMEKLREMGANVVMAGTTPQDDGRSKVLSLSSHKLGLNLQTKHAHNLVLSPPSAAGDWDQLIARTHRAGQTEDEVTVRVLLHTQFSRSEFVRAVENAAFLRRTLPTAPKLLLADYQLSDEPTRKSINEIVSSVSNVAR